MKKIVQILSIVVCFLLIALMGCVDKYTDEEVVKMRNTFASFDNDEDFALTYSNRIWLIDKTIVLDDINYQGSKVDGLFGCEDKFCYIFTKNKIATGNYMVRLLKMHYDTFEMEEIGRVENLKEKSMSSRRYYNGKLYFSNESKYCVYDIKTGKQEWFDYDYEMFWKEGGKYDFEIENISNDCIVNVTDNDTGSVKKISWCKDLANFAEGRYVLQFDGRFKEVNSSFVDCAEKDGHIYVLGMIPLENLCIKYQAVVFEYDFKTESLRYYSCVQFSGYDMPRLNIINR